MASIEYLQCDFCKIEIPVKRDGFKKIAQPPILYGFRFECTKHGNNSIDLCEKCYYDLREYVDFKKKEQK